MAPREQPGIPLANLRLAFQCPQRWDDMAGDDRVRNCTSCDRQVFNLSEMTRADAEALLATRGLTPCVRFYRRADGTVMTSDCPSGVSTARRRLAVVASSIAAGSALAVAPIAAADPVPSRDAMGSDAVDAVSSADGGSGSAGGIELEHIEIQMGLPPIAPTPIADPPPSTEEVGVIEVNMGVIEVIATRPRVEWSLWGRLGTGIASSSSTIAARRTMPAPMTGTDGINEAALGADVTLGVARDGNLRIGAWGELRTTTDPVAGAELVLEGLPPHPYDSRIGGTGSLVLRAGANARVITGAFGVGYIGAWPSYDPWVGWARHVVGARLMLSVNRAIDEPRDWSATLGLEVEPIGLAHALLRLVTR